MSAELKIKMDKNVKERESMKRNWQEMYNTQSKLKKISTESIAPLSNSNAHAVIKNTNSL